MVAQSGGGLHAVCPAAAPFGDGFFQTTGAFCRVGKTYGKFRNTIRQCRCINLFVGLRCCRVFDHHGAVKGEAGDQHIGVTHGFDQQQIFRCFAQIHFFVDIGNDAPMSLRAEQHGAVHHMQGFWLAVRVGGPGIDGQPLTGRQFEGLCGAVFGTLGVTGQIFINQFVDGLQPPEINGRLIAPPPAVTVEIKNPDNIGDQLIQAQFVVTLNMHQMAVAVFHSTGPVLWCRVVLYWLRSFIFKL